MKRILLSIFSILAGFALVVFSAISVAQPQAVTEVPEAGDTPGLNLEPNNPLYLSRVTIDRFRQWLTIDQQKLFELYLNLSEARWNSVVLMIEQGELDLAGRTLYKTQGYLLKAIELDIDQLDSDNRSTWESQVALQQQRLEQVKQEIPELNSTVDRVLDMTSKYHQVPVETEVEAAELVIPEIKPAELGY